MNNKICLKYQSRVVIFLLVIPTHVNILFIEVPVPSQESERSCICLLGILLFDFGIIRTVFIFYLFFILLVKVESTK
jgi:hypothetical protein